MSLKQKLALTGLAAVIGAGCVSNYPSLVKEDSKQLVLADYKRESKSPTFTFSEFVKEWQPGDPPLERKLEDYIFDTNAKPYDFIAKTMEGKTIDLGEFTKQHKHVLIDFWSTWCEPCKELAPYIKSLQEECNELEVISIVSRDEKENLANFLAKNPSTHQVIYDNKDQIYKNYGCIGLPTVLYIEDGKVRSVNRGFLGDYSIKWLDSIKKRIKK